MTDTTSELKYTPMSRKAAKQLGLLHFTPLGDKKCRQGHQGGLFTVSSFTCVLCTKARNKVTQTMNPTLELMIRGDSPTDIADQRVKEWINDVHAWGQFSKSLYSSNPPASYYRYRDQCMYRCVAFFTHPDGTVETLGPFESPILAIEMLEMRKEKAKP